MNLLRIAARVAAIRLADKYSNRDNGTRSALDVISFVQCDPKPHSKMWTPDAIEKILRRVINYGTPEILYTNAHDWADLRRISFNQVEIETNASLLKMGVVGYLFGMTIMINKSCVPDLISFLGHKIINVIPGSGSFSRKKIISSTFAHVWRHDQGDVHEGSVWECSSPLCVVKPILET